MLQTFLYYFDLLPLPSSGKIDMNGVEPFKDVTLSFDEDNVIHNGLFEDQEPDDQEYESYHSNLTHFYSSSVSSYSIKISATVHWSR